jgi:hypothetical protein
MKQLITCIALMLSITVFSQNDNKGLAKVYKRQGIEIYILSEPVREYTVTGKVTKDDLNSWLNAFNGKEDKKDLYEMIDALISNANRKQKKGKLEFDAIITEDGRTGTLIKFNDPKKE